MTLNDYIELITEFARQDPDLLHVDGVREAVFPYSYEEVVTELSDIGDRMVLIVPAYDKHIHDNGAMGNIWVKNALAIAVQYVEPSDVKSRIAIQSKAESVLDRLYKYLFEKRNTELLYGFDTRSWSSEGIGPIGGSHYGYYAEFSIKDGVVI